MTYNLENAIKRLQECWACIFSETGNPSNTDEQEQGLEDISELLNIVEAKIKAYG